MRPEYSQRHGGHPTVAGSCHSPDAIFGVNDTTAFAAMKEIKRQHLRIPQDIGLIGFTDEFHATVVEPTLTSVMHPTFEMGREAALLFLAQVEAKAATAPSQSVLTTQLVVRESSTKILVE
ncbi:substrate-binding domain-containing protein [Hymenobacter volaticus]|uniref:Substrate-binding domain-containing protein n=1 Tax=Hymenobacter volaticus TaxID=2932254 RepID=A0ABY4GCF7_9BACT|nr:substrate-binding domain-containing protein [Hymenobacter volaticus]UOQ68486.1 substrate-binding domain-containing protein [Hymenobacter volaticus]